MGALAPAEVSFQYALDTLAQNMQFLQGPADPIVGANLLGAARNIGDGLGTVAAQQRPLRPGLFETLQASQGNLLLLTESYLRGDQVSAPHYYANELSKIARPLKEAITDLTAVQPNPYPAPSPSPW